MSEVVTGEAVVLELPVATFPSRLLALAIDLILQVVLFGLVVFAVGLLALGQLNADYLAAIMIGGYVAVTVGYPTVFETLTRGKTPGKMALGLRVVGDDGSPERFRQALVRSLVGLLEIYSLLLSPVALITSLVSAKGKRLGDVFAGTYVLQERMPRRVALPPAFAVVPPPLAAWAQTVQTSGLSDQTADAAGSYLRRFAELAPRPREALGIQLANAVAAEVSPPPPVGTPPTAYLAAVLAVRRERDAARDWSPTAVSAAWLQQRGVGTPAVPPPVPPRRAASPADASQPPVLLRQPGVGTPAVPPSVLPRPAASPADASQPTAGPQPVSPAAAPSAPDGGATPDRPSADQPPGFVPPA
jgi:uncharacterized RDD family membrane protein YckC